MRKAVDTNVLVRLLIVDDADQSARAADLLSRGVLEVETTVVLETEWILRGVLRLDRMAVDRHLSDLLSLPNIRFVEEARVIAAVALHRQGMDFADALHLLGSSRRNEFVTFDRDLVKQAGRLRVGTSVQLL